MIRADAQCRAGSKPYRAHTMPGGGGRNDLAIRASYDEGKTWPVAKRLHKGGSAYSDLAVLPDGSICCLYEADGYKTITFAKFPLRWLTGEEKQ